MTSLMLAALLSLGTWQVQRLHWKENLLATIDTRLHQAPADVSTLSNTEDVNYRHATASGTLQNTHIFYLSAISQTGQGGYHILTPLALADGTYLLADRGWIPYDHKNGDFSRPEGPITLSGILRIPEHFWFQPPNNPAKNDWYAIDFPALATAAHIPALKPYLLEVDATDAQTYPTGGQTRVTIPNNHLVYAITWYGMAVALLVIYLLSSFRKDAAD